MKSIKLTYLFLFLLLIQACSNPGNLTVKNLKAESAYLIIPIQENAPDIRFSITDEAGERTVYSYIRLAKDSIDYWVKYPLGNYKGETIELNFEGEDLASFGIDKIYQADSLPINYNEKYRPNFHFSPDNGWMNDPNGMVYLDGEYHLFYQYNPYGNKWGNMHWGHAVSNDLMSWTYLGTPIAPDHNGAIFSGSAVIDKDNTAGFGKNAMIAIFTSDGKTQTQSIAYSVDKGRTFKVYEGNPVIKNPGIPDFRDPKVSWNDQISKWVMVLATRQTVTFFSSNDLKEWEKMSEFGDGLGSHGGVWECPDLFPLQYNGKTKWVLIVSINPGGPNNGSATQYFIGDFNGKEFKADDLPYPLWVDHGQDNYAGVTWSNIPPSDNRKIFLGWMTNWNYANDVPTQNFRNAMTVPRELFLKDNGEHIILASRPVAELKNIEKPQAENKDLVVSDSVCLTEILDGLKGSFSLEMDILPLNSRKFGFKLVNSKNEFLCFNFNLENKYLSVDRKKSGKVDFNRNFLNVSSAPLKSKKIYHLKLIVDKASSELFVNDGDLVTSNTFFPAEDMNMLSFFSQEGSINVKNIKVNKIN